MKHCVTCGAAIKAASHPANAARQRYCSARCARRYFTALRTTERRRSAVVTQRACQRCGQMFAVRPNVGDKHRWCSRPCQQAHYNDAAAAPRKQLRAPRPCVDCGGTFEPKLWTSRRCAACIHRLDNRRNNRKLAEKRKHRPECRERYRRQQVAWRSRNRDKYNADIRQYRIRRELAKMPDDLAKDIRKGLYDWNTWRFRERCTIKYWENP